MDVLAAFLSGQLTHAPLYIVWLVAIIIAIVRWSHHPRASLIAIIAIVSLWVVTTGSMFVFMWLPRTLRAKGMGMSEVAQASTIVSLVSYLLQAGCWAGIVVAMFGWRHQGIASPSR